MNGYPRFGWVDILRFQHYAKRLVPEKAGWVEQRPGNIVKLRLGDLDKLQKVFEKVVLRAIRFAPESIEAEIALL